MINLNQSSRLYWHAYTHRVLCSTEGRPQSLCSPPQKPITKILSPFLRLLHDDSLIVQCEVKWLENSTIKAPRNIQQQQNNPNPTIPITETSTKFVYHTHSWTINDFSSYRTFVQDKPACVEHFLECPKILNENILDSTNSTVQLYARLYPIKVKKVKSGKVSNSLQLSLCLDGNYHSRIVQPIMARIKILSKKDNILKNYQTKFKNIFSKQKFQIQVSYNKIHVEGDLALEIENRLNQFTLGTSFSRPWKPKRVNNVSTLSSSVTAIPLVPYRFVWSIETREQYCEQFESPKYSPLEGEQLNIFLKFNRTDKSIHLCSEMRYENKIYVWVHMSILDRNQNILHKKNGFSTFKNGSSEWIFLGLLDDWISPNQLENGYLKIECELNLINEKTEHSIPATRNQIHKDLNSLLVNEPQTDVVFHFGTDRKLYAHSGILQFRSRVFEDLFNDQKDDKQIDIDFSDVDTFEAMLQFVYTEEFVQIIDCADRLLPLADKFNLDSLKAICENMLIAKLKAKSEQSIMQSPKLLLLANRHKANRLKDMAMEIINENKAPIRGTSAWQEIKTDPDLIEELFLYDSNEESLKRKRTNSNSS